MGWEVNVVQMILFHDSLFVLGSSNSTTTGSSVDDRVSNTFGGFPIASEHQLGSMEPRSG